MKKVRVKPDFDWISALPQFQYARERISDKDDLMLVYFKVSIAEVFSGKRPAEIFREFVSRGFLPHSICLDYYWIYLTPIYNPLPKGTMPEYGTWVYVSVPFEGPRYARVDSLESDGFRFTVDVGAGTGSYDQRSVNTACLIYEEYG